MPQSQLNDNLQALNNLLVRERKAITHLKMEQLSAIQKEKSLLIEKLHRCEPSVSEKEKAVITSIQKNNERNRLLLESGLKLVKRLQDNTFHRMALTYAPRGRSMHIGAGPRVFSRSV